jgi:hypothetical protein
MLAVNRRNDMALHIDDNQFRCCNNCGDTGTLVRYLDTTMIDDIYLCKMCLMRALKLIYDQEIENNKSKD